MQCYPSGKKGHANGVQKDKVAASNEIVQF